MWHKHENEDEIFYVLKGQFKMESRSKIVQLKKHEFLIVPKGVEHRPVAEEVVAIMLFEPGFNIKHKEYN